MAAPLLALATVAAPSPLSAQSVQSAQPAEPVLPVQPRILSYDRDFVPSPDGLIEYNIFAVATVLKESVSDNDILILGVPSLQPDSNGIKHHIDLYRVRDHAWYSPRGLFPQRVITPQEAVQKGAPEQAVDDALNTPNALSVVFYEASYIYDDTNGGPTFPTEEAHRARGDVALNVAVPSHPGGHWWLSAASAIGERKGIVLDLAPGRHIIVIENIEAGNVLVGLTAVDADGGRRSYSQEAYALVRKNYKINVLDPRATIYMEFAEENAANRYRIAYLDAGNNSQSGGWGNAAALPLEEGHEAMVRVRVFDAWGGGGVGPGADQTVTVTWTSETGATGSKTFTSRASGRHVDSGLLFKPSEIDPGRNEHVGLGPKIPAGHVQSSYIDLTATLWGADGQAVDTGTTRIGVVPTRKLTLRGHDFRYGRANVPPYVWENGWQNAEDSEYMLDLLAFAEDTFSYSDISYEYGGKVPVPVPATLGDLLDDVNALQGNQPTDLDAKFETLHMGLTKFQDPGIAGVAKLGKRAFVVRVDRGDSAIGTTISHEMGHCFGLLHAPSPGVDANNYLDTAFPYGGAGMSGGWGYSTLTDTFYGEDDHVVLKAGPDGFLFYTAHYDIMSYSRLNVPFYVPRAKFSDYNALKLKPNLRDEGENEDENEGEGTAPALGFAAIPGVRPYPGTQTLVYGPEAALAMGALDPDDAQAHAWLLDQHDASAFYMDEEIQSLLADPGTPPSVIFTVVPKFDDLEVID
jgi:hypothetical protein